MTYMEDEDGADIVEKIIIQAEMNVLDIYISFVTITEIFYITLQEKGENEARKRVDLIRSLFVTIIQSNDTINIHAGKIKAKNRLSLADSFIAALCIEYNGILVHKDPEFEQLKKLITMKKLPYKSI
jgi:predicted nucleic acid-binding protein